jgi:uncharacterized membrane protein (DUF4010 family)
VLDGRSPIETRMDQTPDLTLVWHFAMALLIGALIGIEREQHRTIEPHSGVGGLRTFILLALCGAVSAWLSRQLDSPWILIAVVVVVSGAVVAGYVVEARAGTEALGLTTEVAAIVTVLLGAACLIGHPDLAVALGIVVSAVLAYKQPLHTLVGRLARDDLYAGLKLLIATFIVLPLLPARPIDPWGALNPKELWLLVILISFLSLIGYVAVRTAGARRGNALTGLFGGMVSSTAVTLTFARQSRESRGSVGMARALAAGMLLAWSAMFARVIVEVAAVHAPLLPSLLIPFAAMGLAALAAAALLYRLGHPGATHTDDAPVEVPVTNPFSLTSAMKFALLFAVVLLAVELAEQTLSGRGVFAVAALAGLTDVDAITLSMASFARDGGHPGTAVTSIVIAALANTVTKCALVAGLGSGPLRRAILAATALVLASGAAALALM